jgi:hypothetical protein
LTGSQGPAGRRRVAGPSADRTTRPTGTRLAAVWLPASLRIAALAPVPQAPHHSIEEAEQQTTAPAPRESMLTSLVTQAPARLMGALEMVEFDGSPSVGGMGSARVSDQADDVG